MKYTFASQSLHLDSIPNARDLGGYIMPDGRRIKKGLLMRGGYLKSASDADIRRLSDEFHLAYIFDFRTETEVKRAPDKFVAGAQNVWMPTIDPETEQKSDLYLPVAAYRDLHNYIIENCSDENVRNIARVLYPNLIDNEYTQLQYAAFIQTILKLPKSNVHGRGVYWHCSQGKDRTGLGSTFLLLALGADMDLILEDFNLSNDYYKEEIDELIKTIRQNGGNEDDFDVVRSFVGVSEKNFLNTIESINKNYGSLDDYLSNQILVSQEDRNLLQDYYLE